MSDTPTGDKRTAKKAPSVKKAATRARSTAARPEATATIEPEEDLPPPPEPTLLADRSSADGRVYRLIAGVAGLIALLLVGALIYAVLRIGDNNSTNSLRNSALRDAITYGGWVSSYDYTDLTAPSSTWTLIESHSTPAFKSSFEKTKANLTSLVKDYNASATGKVVNAGVASVSSSRAVVLLFIDQTVKNKLQKNGPTTEPLRALLFLTRSHGKWLINDLQVPP